MLTRQLITEVGHCTATSQVHCTLYIYPLRLQSFPPCVLLVLFSRHSVCPSIYIFYLLWKLTLFPITMGMSSRSYSPADVLIVAEANSPLQYPTQGVKVRPLKTIIIPGNSMSNTVQNIKENELMQMFGLHQLFVLFAFIISICCHGHMQPSSHVVIPSHSCRLSIGLGLKEGKRTNHTVFPIFLGSHLRWHCPPFYVAYVLFCLFVVVPLWLFSMQMIYQVHLTAALGTFDVAATVDMVSIKGEGEKQIMLSSPLLSALNRQLQLITYTNTMFNPKTADTGKHQIWRDPSSVTIWINNDHTRSQSKENQLFSPLAWTSWSINSCFPEFSWCSKVPFTWECEYN